MATEESRVLVDKDRDGIRFVVALLYAPGPGESKADPVRGTTRLEKLAFLAQEEMGFPQLFKFEPYDFGPWSSDLVDSVEALTAAGLVSVVERTLTSRYQEGDELLFAEGAVDGPGSSATTPNILRSYELSQKGLVAGPKLWASLSGGERSSLASLKRDFNRMPLSDLLKYVYERHAESASKSKIRASVLSRRGSRPWLRDPEPE